MTAVVLIFVGGGLGAVLRHFVNVAAASWFGTEFPWGTFTVNVVGSLAMGLIAGWLAFKSGENWTQHARLFLTTGILGGFTTFSAFSLDIAVLWERGAPGLAGLYAFASVALSAIGLFLGLWAVRAMA